MSTQLFREKLKDFIVNNGIIGTTAGVIIALVSKDLIMSLTNDIIFPSIILLLLMLNIDSLNLILPDNSKIDLLNFLKQLFSWGVVIVITYIFIKNIFEKILSIDDIPKEQELKEDSFISYHS
jgi:large-conductance mechanosensitive channel